MENWTVAQAKIVLDLVNGRLVNLRNLSNVIHNKKTLEVQTLQPLIDDLLWVFGPEYESVEFTSNRAINTVLKKFGKPPTSTEKLRPDFVVRPDHSVVFNKTLDRYDDDGEVDGIAKLAIIELKRPGIPINFTEIGQCIGYANELREQGLITKATKVRGFILGESTEASLMKTENDNWFFQPMTYDHFVRRGDVRMFDLRKKILQSPFNGETLDQHFSRATNDVQGTIEL